MNIFYENSVSFFFSYFVSQKKPYIYLFVHLRGVILVKNSNGRMDFLLEKK